MAACSEFLHREGKGQLVQDLWVLAMTGGKKNGYFVELGSSDGVELNNTYVLEKEFGWNGICVEANPRTFELLKANRSNILINRAVWNKSGEKTKFILAGVLGSMIDVAFNDGHSERRRQRMASSGTVIVETISAHDLLVQNEAPGMIDYLSLDIEGAELTVFQNIDLKRWKFALATIEHNSNSKARAAIMAALGPLGYKRRQIHYDDWYYNPDLLRTYDGMAGVDFDEITEAFAEKLQAP